MAEPLDVPMVSAGEIAFDAPQPVVDEANPADSFLATTSIGRVLDSFGQGAKAGWGAGPLGLSPESEKAMREGGIFKTAEPSLMDSFKAFNEGLIRPAAAGLDLVMRSVGAVGTGIAGAVGQTAEELGADQGQARRLTRDTLMLGETLGIVTGNVPSLGRMRGARTATEDFAAAAPDGPAAKAFPKPEAPVRAADDFVPETPVIDKAGNINLDRIEASKDVKDVIREVATKDEFLEGRRGVMSLKDTEELADALGMTPEVLTSRNIGQAFNAEEAVAARNLLVQSAENVRNLALKAANGADTDIISFQEAMTKHVAIQEQVAGLTAEAGRALSSFRIMAKGTGEATDLAEVIKQMGGRDNVSDIAKKISSFNSPQQISKFLMDSRQAKTSDMLTEVWINALLSGPQTHVVNVVSNSLIALWRVPETAAAAGVGKIRQTFGLGAADRVVFSEVAARTWGYGQGAKEGVVAAWRMFKSDMGMIGEGGDIATSQFGSAAKVEARNRRAVPSGTVTIGSKQFEIGGAQLRTPTNLLSAEDEFFKSIGYRQELNALAYRQATNEALTGQAFADRVAGIVNDPPNNLVKQARDNADYQTFQKKLGPLAGSVQQFSNAHPAAKVIIPFVRTPVNILKFAGERSPLGMFSDEFKGLKSGVEQDTAIARVALGSSIGAATVSLAAEGMITGGGPTDSRQRAVLYASGWQPYSVKIGDMYYSYSRFDPFALTMGISADMYDIGSKMDELEASKLAALITASVSKNLINKTWLKGPAELIEAVADPDRYGDKYVQHLLGTVVPTGAAQIARVEDPYLRDANTLIETIKSRTPGLSQDLLPKRDIWGEPIKLEGGLGPDMFSPIYEKRITNDTVAQELIRLKIWPAAVDKKIKGVELTPAQHDTYAQYAGRFMRFNLETLVNTPGWTEQPEFARREVIEKTVTKSRQTATSLMLMENPDLIEKAVQGRVDKITGAKPGK